MQERRLDGGHPGTVSEQATDLSIYSVEGAAAFVNNRGCELQELNEELFLFISSGERSESAASATTLATDGVGGDGGDVLDSADLEALSGERTEGSLGAGAGGLGVGAALGLELDVNRVDADDLERLGHLDGGKHS